MEHSPITWERGQTARLLEVGIRFFLAAALTASQTAGGYAPFALGLVSAAGAGLPGAAALESSMALRRMLAFTRAISSRMEKGLVM